MRNNIIAMFLLLKTKRMVIQNQFNSSVLFCNFINQRRVLLIFANKTIAILQTQQTQSQRIVFQDKLNTGQNIIDCQRIKTNVCAILSSKLETLTFIKYVSDQQILMGSIFIKQMQFFDNFNLSSNLLPFHSHLFAIKSDLLSQKMVYFTLFRQKLNQQFSYDISIINYQYDPITSKEQIFKSLDTVSELVFFKQKEDQGIEWKLKIIALENAVQHKDINITEIWTEKHSILDIIAKGNNQYCLFVERQDQLAKTIQVYSIRLYETNNNFVQNISFLFSFDPQGLFVEVIDSNPKEGYFLTKILNHHQENNQIFDNILQIRSLKTGQLIDSMSCNLKSLAFNIDRTCILDFSQSVSEHSHIILHFRAIINKRTIYYFLLGHNRLREQKEIERYASEIFEIL